MILRLSASLVLGGVTAAKSIISSSSERRSEVVGEGNAFVADLFPVGSFPSFFVFFLSFNSGKVSDDDAVGVCTVGSEKNGGADIKESAS